MSADDLDPISDQAFIRDWETIRSHALNAGVHYISDLDFTVAPPQTALKSFFRDVHRSYERAQTTIADRLMALQSVEGISEAERLHRQLALRKIADAMAYTMAEGQAHLIRRFATNRAAGDVPLDKLPEYLAAAQRLNAESRMTFALLADLTTFVHVGDLLRIDVRTKPAVLTHIELKTGPVNAALLRALEETAATPESIAAIPRRRDINRAHVRQAQRILRQRLRTAQVETLLRTDRGIDPGTGLEMQLSEGVITTEEYDQDLASLLDFGEAKGGGYCTVDGCLHVGVHYAAERASFERAYGAAKAALRSAAATDALARAPFVSALGIPKDDGEHSFTTDPYAQGLLAPAVRPFSLWRLPARHRSALMTFRARVAVIIDTVALAQAFARQDMTLRYTSRRELARLTSAIPGSHFIIFRNMGLACDAGDGTSVLLKGTFSRFVYELVRPSSYLAGVARENTRMGRGS